MDLGALPLRPRRSLAVAATLLAVVLGAVGLAGCGDDGSSDPDATGARAQAIEELADYGLSDEEAACIADELGAESVVEASDLTALMDSQEYRSAAETCIDG